MKNQDAKLLVSLEKILGEGRVEKNKDLTRFLTMRTKTTARFFFEAKTKEDLIKAKKASLATGLSILIIGGGSNLVITRKKIDGLVVKNNYIDWQLIKEENNNVLVSFSSGYPVTKLVRECIERGWAGVQYFEGLPGTVGGAVYNNAKWTKPMIAFGDNLVTAYLVDNFGNTKKVDQPYFHFAYDFSILKQTKEILLTAVFRLKKSSPTFLKKQALAVFAYRKTTQPQGVFSSGCFFKNPKGRSAGYLIDQVGFKGFRVGGFQVSNLHANFIINCGNGKIADLKKLIKIIKERVKNKFGVKLEEEVEIID